MAPSVAGIERTIPRNFDGMKAVSARPAPPKFASKLEERAYLKFRLAQAFRIFGETSPQYIFS